MAEWRVFCEQCSDRTVVTDPNKANTWADEHEGIWSGHHVRMTTEDEE